LMQKRLRPKTISYLVRSHLQFVIVLVTRTIKERFVQFD